MNAKTMRILKEARSLFWPWCAVTVAGTLPLLERSTSVLREDRLWGVHQLFEPISIIGFFLGIPLLATLSLGYEFQHRTLPLLLSQPISRMEIWGEKMGVTLVAVVSAALVFCADWRSMLQQDPGLWVFCGASIVAMTASATFWTLVARSTMGGLALNGVNSFIPLAWLLKREWIPGTITGRSAAAFAFMSYLAVMLWLGRRMLVRFEVTGGMAGEDLLMAGPDMMPRALAGWFRSRPTGAVLNLIRKEFRLLRPVWLISLLAVPVWICLPVFGFTVEHGSAAAVLMMVAFIPLIAVLAGTMSLGEERTSGTHCWHLTLPVSSRRQWLIKLGIAMFTGLVCAAVIPISILTAERYLFGAPLMSVNLDAGITWLLGVALLSFASFWCSCAVKGTVQAALWVFPVLIAVTIAGASADGVAWRVMYFVGSRFDLFTNFRFTNTVSNVHLFSARGSADSLLALLLVPALVFAVIQSCRLFRKQLQDGALFVVRRVLPLAMIAFVCTFSFGAFNTFVAHARQQMWTMFRETHEAIEKIQPGTPNLDATHPLQLTGEDLFEAVPVSERTQRWLRGSSISVAPNELRTNGKYCCGGNSGRITYAPEKAYSWYLATIHLRSGSECTLSFQGGRGFGILGGVCE